MQLLALELRRRDEEQESRRPEQKDRRKLSSLRRSIRKQEWLWKLRSDSRNILERMGWAEKDFQYVEQRREAARLEQGRLEQELAKTTRKLDRKWRRRRRNARRRERRAQRASGQR